MRLLLLFGLVFLMMISLVNAVPIIERVDTVSDWGSAYTEYRIYDDEDRVINETELNSLTQDFLEVKGDLVDYWLSRKVNVTFMNNETIYSCYNKSIINKEFTKNIENKTDDFVQKICNVSGYNVSYYTDLIWVEIENFDGLYVPAGETFDFRINGIFEMKDGHALIDNWACINSSNKQYCYTQYDWWNSSWTHYKVINVSTTDIHTDKLIDFVTEFNFTGIKNVISVRIIYNDSEEIPYNVLSYGNDWIRIFFPVDCYNDSNNYYKIYYGNPSITSWKDYGIETPFRWFTDYDEYSSIAEYQSAGLITDTRNGHEQISDSKYRTGGYDLATLIFNITKYKTLFYPNMTINLKGYGFTSAMHIQNWEQGDGNYFSRDFRDCGYPYNCDTNDLMMVQQPWFILNDCPMDEQRERHILRNNDVDYIDLLGYFNDTTYSNGVSPYCNSNGTWIFTQQVWANQSVKARVINESYAYAEITRYEHLGSGTREGIGFLYNESWDMSGLKYHSQLLRQSNSYSDWYYFSNRPSGWFGVEPTITLSTEQNVSDSPIFSLNSTSSTYAGNNVTHFLKWEDDVALSGYIFKWHNGTNWTKISSSGDIETDEQNFRAKNSSSIWQTFFDNFDDRMLGTNWSTYVSDATYGRIGIRTEDSHSGSYAVISDVSSNGHYSLNELKTNYNFSNGVELILSFWHREWADEDSSGADHIDHYNSDSYYFTCDGTNWKLLGNLGSSSGWTKVEVNITDDSDWCGTLDSNFKIKFTQYDNYGLTSDGRGFDDINITWKKKIEAEKNENKTPVIYEDVVSDLYEQLNSISVTVYVSYYNNSGSQQNGNTNTTLWLEVYNGSDWIDEGSFFVTGIGNYTIIVNTSSILTAWQTEENRDIRISAKFLDYNDTNAYDQINWSGVWVKVDSEQEFLSDSWVSFPSGGTEDWSNVTKTVTSQVGAIVKWRVYANDSDNLWTMSDTYYYTTTSPLTSNCSYTTDTVLTDENIACDVFKVSNGAKVTLENSKLTKNKTIITSGSRLILINSTMK